MRFSRTLSLVVLAAAMLLLATACPQSGGGDSTGGSTATSASTTSSGGSATPVGTSSTADKPVDDGGLEFSFKTFDGVEHKLSDYRGKPVVVNFFGVT